jgi:hypothetical protein
MQAVVPSQVVAAILRFFPSAKELVRTQLSSDQLPLLMVIVRLVRRVPSELFTVPIEQYVWLEFAIENIDQALKRSEREPLAFPLAQMSGGSPIQVIYEVLTACPDSVPASSAVNLGFITDAKTRKHLVRDRLG